MKVKEVGENAGLKLSIQKTKIMVSGPSLHGKQKGGMWKQGQQEDFCLGLQNHWGQ